MIVSSQIRSKKSSPSPESASRQQKSSSHISTISPTLASIHIFTEYLIDSDSVIPKPLKRRTSGSKSISEHRKKAKLTMPLSSSDDICVLQEIPDVVSVLSHKAVHRRENIKAPKWGLSLVWETTNFPYKIWVCSWFMLHIKITFESPNHLSYFTASTSN